jgi:hypothetical protein
LARAGRALLIGFSVLLGFLVYAYGFQVTKVDLEETKSERRQEQLFRILRALAQPDLIEYDRHDTSAEAPVYVRVLRGMPLTAPPPANPYHPQAGCADLASGAVIRRVPRRC